VRGVDAFHAGLSDALDLVAGGVEVAVAVGARGGGGGRGVAVVGRGAARRHLGGGGAVPIAVNRRHQVVRGVPHGGEHRQAGVHPWPGAHRSRGVHSLGSGLHVFVGWLYRELRDVSVGRARVVADLRGVSNDLGCEGSLCYDPFSRRNAGASCCAFQTF